ncbi:serine hydrolase [Alkalihalophilus marmarensis]|uniref:serine hydrolase n=1 Tax=Alkalihalophilus marmarensis TaxID=521377 RepID=UPI002DB6A017|nr:serine hydrolase [Alkalihalophilus marmarensis]MEC2071324.1 serine hydrolase [Alkalihalophilus marmarensis]
MRKYITALSVLLAFFLVFQDEAKANVHPGVFLEEKKLSFDVQPTIISGVTFIELRGLCNALSYNLGWDQGSRTASCSTSGKNFSFSINDAFYTYNGTRTAFTNRPTIINGRTMISLREVSQVFSYNVTWLQFSKEILLMRPHVSDEVRGRMADDFLKRLHANNRFNGAALVAKQNQIITENGYGKADIEGGVANTTDTKFAIASITKGFTGTAIMQLQEEGKLKVTDRLSQHFPHLPYADKITIHQLLTHTAGLPWEKDRDFAQIELIYTPGTNQRYSNVGYLLLGELIEKASGLTFADYMNQRVFNKLGMDNSGYDINSSSAGIRAKGYSYENGRLVPVNRDFTLRGASGSLYSSAKDLYRLDQALYNNELMERSTMHSMLTAHSGNWGYGWQVYPLNTGRVTQLTGSTVGFTSHIKRNEGRKYVIVLLSNHADPDIHVIGSTIETIIR